MNEKTLERMRGEYFFYRIPGMVLTETGALVAYYECRNDASDWAEIDIKVIRSEDGGDTWQVSKIVNGENNTLNNPVMIVDGSTIHFLYCKNYKELYYSKSLDDGKSFSSAENISYAFENGGFFYNAAAIGPGHGIAHNGDLMIPVWFAYNGQDPKAHRPSFISTLYSSDHGKSWQLGERIDGDGLINPSECCLAVTEDDRVLISIRNENSQKRRAFAISDTGYSGWSKACFAENMSDPICQGSMTELDGEIFHINCVSENARAGLTVKKSRDLFKTFDEILVDCEGGYSDIAVRNGELCIIYERDLWGPNGLIQYKKIKI